MKEIERYVADHRSQFDDVAMPQDHRKRFGKKLRTKNYRLRSMIAMVSAAVIVVCVLVMQNQNRQHEQFCEMSNEVDNVLSYYSASLEEDVDQVKELLQDVDPQVRREIEGDLQSMLSEDQEFNNLVKSIEESESLWLQTQRYSAQKEALERIKLSLTNRI